MLEDSQNKKPTRNINWGDGLSEYEHWYRNILSSRFNNLVIWSCLSSNVAHKRGVVVQLLQNIIGFVCIGIMNGRSLFLLWWTRCEIVFNRKQLWLYTTQRDAYLTDHIQINEGYVVTCVNYAIIFATYIYIRISRKLAVFNSYIMFEIEKVFLKRSRTFTRW